MSHDNLSPSHGEGAEAYRPPRLIRYGRLEIVTASRLGSGNDLLDGRRLAKEPMK